MKGIAWVRHQDEALKAGWLNDRMTAEDIADIISVPLFAVRHRARKLKLGAKIPVKSRAIVSLIHDDIAVIFLENSIEHPVYIDEKDLFWFTSHAYSWYVHTGTSGKKYVYSSSSPPKKLHRLLLDAKSGELVDHINGNGLDNTRKNIRIATSTQNSQNSRKNATSKSEFKGVWFHALSGLYGGAITFPDGRRKSIGYYKTSREAARARDAIVAVLHKEFAFLSFPDDRMSDTEIDLKPSLRTLINLAHSVSK